MLSYRFLFSVSVPVPAVKQTTQIFVDRVGAGIKCLPASPILALRAVGWALLLGVLVIDMIV